MSDLNAPFFHADIVREFARDTWDGLYAIRREHDNVWRVTLHAPNGPTHLVLLEVTGPRVYCHESHHCV